MSQQTQYVIADVCDDIKDLLLAKNEKYGDSAINPTRVFSKADPVEQIKVRIDDKLSRIKSSGDMDDAFNEDTVTDLIGYLVLLKVAQRVKVLNAETPGQVLEDLVRETQERSTSAPAAYDPDADPCDCPTCCERYS